MNSGYHLSIVPFLSTKQQNLLQIWHIWWCTTGFHYGTYVICITHSTFLKIRAQEKCIIPLKPFNTNHCTSFVSSKGYILQILLDFILQYRESILCQIKKEIMLNYNFTFRFVGFALFSPKIIVDITEVWSCRGGADASQQNDSGFSVAFFKCLFLFCYTIVKL